MEEHETAPVTRGEYNRMMSEISKLKEERAVVKMASKYLNKTIRTEKDNSGHTPQKDAKLDTAKKESCEDKEWEEDHLMEDMERFQINAPYPTSKLGWKSPTELNDKTDDAASTPLPNEHYTVGKQNGGSLLNAAATFLGISSRKNEPPDPEKRVSAASAPAGAERGP